MDHFNIFRVSFFNVKVQNGNIFLGYIDSMDISGGHCKIGLYYGIISIFLGYLFKVKVQNGNIFGGRSILNSFGVCLILPIFFGENNRCWV